MVIEQWGSAPKCPNHGCPLMISFPMPVKGNAPCSISGVNFAFEISPDEKRLQIDKEGRTMEVKKFSLTGSDT